MSFSYVPVTKRGGEGTFQKKLVRTYIRCSCILLHILLTYKYIRIVLVWNKELLNFIQTRWWWWKILLQCLYMLLNNFFPSLQMWSSIASDWERSTDTIQRFEPNYSPLKKKGRISHNWRFTDTSPPHPATSDKTYEVPWAAMETSPENYVQKLPSRVRNVKKNYSAGLETSRNYPAGLGY